ncbi:5-formyltetrahydrofolate cyclo-ligase [Olleya sp. HaHaR_3_96]|uniref:5-formyltetrahydrofolate cyclo-ligase n=1 Tax=Olleya sp. HaHaR_3_96 TaxID=2745560 RepID=UPI001C4FD93C|nr:5-formyltetrahydrofolate cyclo-ligase [Olleya sp. HaHaR_3_96]QXP60382.1 5-formyltetrahydrofolate cyclo-ligase [Olleya sp. HaHaR_3_96]
MKKAELRRKYKALRGALSEANIDDKSIAIANQLLTLSIWDYSFYHLFLTIETHQEVNTDFILNILSGKDKNIVISKSNFKTNTLSNYLLTDATTLKLSAYNIPEPVDGIDISNDKIDVVFVPLLAFDTKGHRVGYGKGFYDKFLASCNPGTIKIGLSFFEAEAEIEDVFENDVTLDYCVTPEKIYKF